MNLSAKNTVDLHIERKFHTERQEAREMSKPNILMITCHDIGQHIGCYGVDSVQTPNLDNLAFQGVRFENFYSTAPVCSPARGSLHIGRYPQSNGLVGLTHTPWWWTLNEHERHTAALLGDCEYDTYLVGVNHVHDAPGRLGYHHILSPERNAVETVAETRNLFQAAQSAERPFFAKVGFYEVHRPFINGRDTAKGVFVPPWLQDSQQVKDDFAAFQGTIKYFDECVGEILDALAASEIADNTLVIMTSDHGIPYPGAKWTVRKAGIEVPLIIYQPGTVFSGGKAVSQIMSNVDVLPTLLDYLGEEIPDNMQGYSFMNLIRGGATEAPRKEAFAQYTPDMKRDNTSRSIITERYHLIRYFDAGRLVDYPVDVHPQAFANHVERCRTKGKEKGTRPFVQLFDITQDPYEVDDIGAKAQNKDIVLDLSRRLYAWMKNVKDPLLHGPLRTPYYDRAMADFVNAACP